MSLFSLFALDDPHWPHIVAPLASFFQHNLVLITDIVSLVGPSYNIAIANVELYGDVLRNYLTLNCVLLYPVRTFLDIYIPQVCRVDECTSDQDQDVSRSLL